LDGFQFDLKQFFSDVISFIKKQRKPFRDPETAARQKNQSDLNTSDQTLLETLTSHNLKQ